LKKNKKGNALEGLTRSFVIKEKVSEKIRGGKFLWTLGENRE
jgi:hypothetical protein